MIDSEEKNLKKSNIICISDSKSKVRINKLYPRYPNDLKERNKLSSKAISTNSSNYPSDTIPKRKRAGRHNVEPEIYKVESDIKIAMLKVKI